MFEDQLDRETKLFFACGRVLRDQSENIMGGGWRLFDFLWQNLGTPSKDWQNLGVPPQRIWVSPLLILF